MTTAEHAIPSPVYVAMVAEEYLESDDDLNKLLRLLRRLHDPTHGEDICIWKEDKTIAAVVRHDGTILRYEPEEKQAPPANGTAKRQRR